MLRLGGQAERDRSWQGCGATAGGYGWPRLRPGSSRPGRCSALRRLRLRRAAHWLALLSARPTRMITLRQTTRAHQAAARSAAPCARQPLRRPQLPRFWTPARRSALRPRPSALARVRFLRRSAINASPARRRSQPETSAPPISVSDRLLRPNVRRERSYGDIACPSSVPSQPSPRLSSRPAS